MALLIVIGIVGYVKNSKKTQNEEEPNLKDTTTLVE
jgi:hypothetical protein